MIVPDASLADGERTKLLDFGIAKLSDGQDFVKTRTNAMLGTPVYMSPEQCRGAGKVDDRADVYSFGVLMFVMVAGRPPFTGEGMGDVMGKHMYEAPPPLEDCVPAVPAPLADLVARLLTKDKLLRPSMREVVTELLAMAKELPSLPIKLPRSGVGTAAPDKTAAGVGTLGTLAGLSQQTELTGRGTIKRTGAGLFILFILLVPAALLIPSRLLHKPQVKVVPVPDHPPPSLAAAGATAPMKVRWKLDSQPAGASVVRETDGKLLCKTPCLHEELYGTGSVRLRVGREGYVDRFVQVALDRDGELSETLDPVRRLAKGKKPPLPSAKPVPEAAPPVVPPSPPTPDPKPIIHVRPKIED